MRPGKSMLQAAGRRPPGVVRCIDLGSNQGKRAAMAAGIRATKAEIMVFIDSDSVPAADGVRLLVQTFADPKVGAASGLTYVGNASKNALTRMQQARYYVSFQLLKCAESVVGAVSCNPGCFSAYRRSTVMQVLERWEHQRFLGMECTFGDDRALTNMIIRKGWISRYHSGAIAWTEVPELSGVLPPAVALEKVLAAGRPDPDVAYLADPPAGLSRRPQGDAGRPAEPVHLDLQPGLAYLHYWCIAGTIRYCALSGGLHLRVALPVAAQ